MSQEANVVIYDLMVELEPTYSGSVTLDPTEDGIANLTELPTFNVVYQHTGERSPGQANAGKLRRRQPTGRSIEGTVALELAGATSFSLAAGDVPVAHDLYQMAGFSASLEGGSWIYKRHPIEEAYSGEMLLFGRDTARYVKGAYANLEISFEEPGAALVGTFNVVGISGVPFASATIPTITHADVVPPSAVCLNLNVSGTVEVTDLVLRSATLTLDRDITTPRTDANSCQGISGFAAGRFNPTLTLVVEAEPSKFDAYLYRDLASEFAITFSIGDETYNTIAVTANQATLMEVNEQDDGPVAMWELVWDVHNSSAELYDDVVITHS